MGYTYVNQEIPLLPLTFDDYRGKLFRGTMPWGLHTEASRDEYLALLQSNSITKVVVLVTEMELDFASEEKTPNALQFYKNHQIEPIYFPMADGGVPKDKVAFNKLLENIMMYLKKGDHVLIHCMGGVGRTGLVISCLIKKLMERELGLTRVSDPAINESISAAALNHVRIHIPKALETEAQIKFLKEFDAAVKMILLPPKNKNNTHRSLG